MNGTITKSRSTISLPRASVEAMLDAAAKFSQAQDELEDYMFMSNPAIVKALLKSHKQAKSGKTKSFDSLAKKYGLSASKN